MGTGGTRCIFSNLIVTLGWVTSFHIAGIDALTCGYENGTCSPDGTFAPKAADCTKYYTCVHGKWKLGHCSGILDGGCGTTPSVCKASNCTSSVTSLPSSTATTGITISTSSHAGKGTTGRISTSTSVTQATTLPSGQETTGTKSMDSSPNTGGSSDAGLVSGVVVAVVLVLVGIIIGLLWWKRRDMLLSMFKRKPIKGDQSNTNDQTHHGQDGLYPNGEQVLNNTKNTNRFEKKAPLTLSLSNKSDNSSISMTSNSLYSVGPDEAYYNLPDETKETESAKDTKPCKEHVNSTDNNKNTDHMYSTVSKPTNGKAENNDHSFVLMRGNSLYGSGDDDDADASFNNMADEPKYAACEDDYTYTKLVGDENENETKMEESDYYTTPADVHDIYYSDVK